MIALEGRAKAATLAKPSPIRARSYIPLLATLRMHKLTPSLQEEPWSTTGLQDLIYPLRDSPVESEAQAC